MRCRDCGRQLREQLVDGLGQREDSGVARSSADASDGTEAPDVEFARAPGSTLARRVDSPTVLQRTDEQAEYEMPQLATVRPATAGHTPS